MNKVMDFKVEIEKNLPPLVHLELWPPPQGCSSRCVPVEADIFFGVAEWSRGNLRFETKLTRADVHLSLIGADVIRGSRFGDVVREPYDIAHILEQSRSLLEAERGGEYGGKFALSLEKGFSGEVYLKRVGKSRKANEAPTATEYSTVQQKLIPYPNNVWRIKETDKKQFLEGKYVGIANGSSSSPLCLLSATEQCSIAVEIRFAVDHVVSRPINQRALSRNKEAVIDCLLRRRSEIKPEFRAEPTNPHVGVGARGVIRTC